MGQKCSCFQKDNYSTFKLGQNKEYLPGKIKIKTLKL